MTEKTPPEKMPWPVDIRLNAVKDQLTIRFDDGCVASLSAELLRVESPSAEVQGHHPSGKIHVTGKENVKILGIEPVGHYAVRLTFDDGHATGLYTWIYLYALGLETLGSADAD